MDSRIYICTHLKFDVPGDPVYLPIHAGRAISEDIGYPGDDVGDNISVQNRYFCELTALYWIWKNTEHDITGLCHYRRYLSKDGNPVGGAEIERLMQKYDILLPEAGLTDCPSLYEQYKKYHHIEDLEITRELISEMSPEYLDAFDVVAACNFFNIGNIMITRGSILKEYCEWLFPVLFRLCERSGMEQYDDYQKRMPGFISERLLRVWVMKHAYRVMELPVLSLE